MIKRKTLKGKCGVWTLELTGILLLSWLPANFSPLDSDPPQLPAHLASWKFAWFESNQTYAENTTNYSFTRPKFAKIEPVVLFFDIEVFTASCTMPVGNKVVFKRSKVDLPSILVGSFARPGRTHFADKTGSQAQPASAICWKLKMKYWRAIPLPIPFISASLL